MPDAQPTEADRARRVLECAEIFKRGCSNAGPLFADPTRMSDPAECPECVAAFLAAVRVAFALDPTVSAPGPTDAAEGPTDA